MKQFTDICKAASVAYLNAIEPDDIIPVGHHKAIAAAVAAVAPLLLGEPTPDEWAATDTTAFSSRAGYAFDCVKTLFANRLASLTAKPDAAVEAVGVVIANLGIGYKTDDISDDTLRAIVAAVRAADQKAGRP